MNSSLDFSRGCTPPAAISLANRALCCRAYSLNESTSSELEIVSGGTKIPVPLMAIFVTTHALSDFRAQAVAAGRRTQPPAAKAYLHRVQIN